MMKIIGVNFMYLKQQAARLIAFLQREYHLENKIITTMGFV